MSQKAKFAITLFLICIFIVVAPFTPIIGSGIQSIATLFVGTTPIVGGSNGDCLTISTGKLGSTSCGGGLTIGTTTISGGTNGDCLYDNSGVLGNQACSSGGTIPVTTSTLKGDGAGNAAAVTGTGTNCVLVNGSSTACGGSSPTFPFTIVQEGPAALSGNVNNLTVTFANTTASSGNTIWIVAAGDASQTITMPSGYTTDINVAASNYSRLILVHKATASDTSATFSFSGSTMSAYYFELSGSRSLDQSSTNTGANAQTTVLPAITPTAGSAVFGFQAFTQAGYQWQYIGGPMNQNYRQILVGNPCSSCRSLMGWIGEYTATNVSTTPPAIQFGNTLLLFGSGGLAWATFSIK